MLKLESVKISYGAIQAVKGVSLEVREGEVVTIIGANGAGKSTLLKAIVGLQPVAEGRVLIDGKDTTAVPGHQRVGLGVALSPEGRGVFADQTVRENLMLGAYSRKDGAAAIEASIEREFIRFPRLRERQHQLSGTMSGGEQQMLAMSRALMSEPRLLLLDEPSLGLAPMVAAQLMRLVRRRCDTTGLAVLLVEQNARSALSIADYGMVLNLGREVASGDPQRLAADDDLRHAYLGF
jgi:branched-chain amino acid transport system ATP-binding protein